MPKGVVKNTAKMSKRMIAAEKKNKKAISSVLSGEVENVIFARVEKSLGCGGFSLLMNDSSTAIGLVRKTTCRVSDKSIVMCSVAEHNKSAKVPSYEIIGVLRNDEAKKFMKEKLLAKHLLCIEEDEEDDIFEISDNEEEEVDVDAI